MCDQNKDIYSALPGLLLPWYQVNKRELPWRENRDPYRVWISEIMLQQTRVEAVKGYYTRFLEALPTIADLAAADDALVHKLWEGLGYYSRARNLKKAAQMIVSQFEGSFPQTYEEVLSLPGIGPYTAGAICSIVYDLPTPAVDGNVQRVISRLTDDDTPVDLQAYKDQVSRQLQQIYPEQAGDFTQALMELGATICGPNQKPDCRNCPCNEICLAYQQGREQTLPVRLPKKARRQEDWTVLILKCDDHYALEKRGSSGLLAELWQFPCLEGILNAEQALRYAEKLSLHPTDIVRQADKKHIFTHIQWNMRGYYILVSNMNTDYSWLTYEQITENAALPTAFRQFWEDHIF